jgi:DMSO reductase anchor subunit
MIFRIIMIIGYIFFISAFGWLAIRYFNRGDKVGAVIFLLAAIFGIVLTIKKFSDIYKIKKDKSNKT